MLPLNTFSILTAALLLVLIAVLYWRIIPQRHQNTFLFIVSILFVAAYSLKYAAYFMLNIGLTYLAASLIIRDGKNKKKVIKLTLFWLIGNLCFFKYAHFLIDAIRINLPVFFTLPAIRFSPLLLPLGISYITFRLVHYIVEVYKGNIGRSSFVDFSLYVLFFPTFLAGPVERFPRFYPQANSKKTINFKNFNYAFYRLTKGLIKKFIIADSIAVFIVPLLNAPQNYSRLVIIIAVYLLAIRIYLDFSGYTDIAIGVAKLFGYEIMENFNRPYLQKNIGLFWRSWHISVSSWIRDYFFFPLFGSNTSAFKLYFGIFLSVVVFHLWHAASLGFLILGIYHGCGLVLWQFFQVAKKKSPFLKEVTSYKWLDPLSVFFTFSFVSFGFIFFNPDFNHSLGLVKRIFLRG